ncbi:hypothetical protein JBF12_46190, partial [Streptomyces javensis]|nr:hypothetical protein [Streptomyces javensis]
MPAASSTALAGFYREHHGWLLGWLRRRTHNVDCAADLTQDTFLRLLSRRVDPSELRLPRAYLSTIAHALLVNHWQRADLERAYLVALAAQPEPVHPSAEERAQALQLLHAIAEMLYGLAEEGHAPRGLSKLSRAAVPARGLLFSCLCLLGGTLLIYLIPNLVTAFTLVTTLATVLFIFVWSLILVAY